jgi:1-acyl-sn-glycerol-3-phosphate acyltransferase
VSEDRNKSKELREKAFSTGDKRSSMVVYRSVRRLIRTVLFPYFSAEAVNTEALNLEGPTILAPVHRSHLDSVLLATFSERRIRALGKESLFTVPVLGYLCAALGAIPVRRGAADREALVAAKTLLDRGESMIVFPEGGRQTGKEIGDLFDGAAWLAARTGARVIPVGIAGTEESLTEGAKFPRRSKVRIVVGEPMPAPVGSDGKRPSREQLTNFTNKLRTNLQSAQSAAVESQALAKRS